MYEVSRVLKIRLEDSLATASKECQLFAFVAPSG